MSRVSENSGLLLSMCVLTSIEIPSTNLLEKQVSHLCFMYFICSLKKHCLGLETVWAGWVLSKEKSHSRGLETQNRLLEINFASHRQLELQIWLQ